MEEPPPRKYCPNCGEIHTPYYYKCWYLPYEKELVKMRIFNNIPRHGDLSIWQEKERQILNDQSDPTPQLSGTDNTPNPMVILNWTGLAPFNSLLQSGTPTALLANVNSLVAFLVLRKITNPWNKSPISQILAI